MTNPFRENLLAGKAAVVAGASSGINLQIATRFAQAGARVAIFSRSEEKIQAAAAGIRALGGEATGFAQDVRDYAGVAATLASAATAYGPFDIVVSGAAGNFVAPALGMSANGFKAVVDIDLLGTYHVFRASHEHLRKPGASLISISAPQALLPYALQAHVGAAKAGVEMLTKVLAVEWAGEGIRVNSIVPGPIAETEGMARLSPNADAENRNRRAIPLQRFGSKDDIAWLALFLCSQAAVNITGATLVSDGGQMLVGAGGMAGRLGA